MPVEIRVPALGESVVDATISRWLKHEGDAITAGEALVELETDKVNVEVPAEQAGTLTRIVKNEGDTVGIGEVLAEVETDGAAQGDAQAVTAQPAPPPAAAQAPAAPPSPQGSAPAAAQAATAPVKDESAVLREDERAPAVDEGAAAPGGDGHGPEPAVSPVARRLAEEHEIDIRKVAGTGPGGRVTKEDVLKLLEAVPAAPSAPSAPAVPAARPPAAAPAAPRPAQPSATPVVPARAAGDREERVRMSRRRQTIARRLVEAQHTAAMLTTFNEIDMSAVMELRKRRRDAFKERHGVNLGFMSFFTKAAIGALKAFPLLNAEIQGDDIVVKHYYDIGIAVGAEEGLVVPVVRDADRKSFAELEREIGDLARRVREGSLTISELQGGTFTITNGGVFGSLMSTPILNAPQVGILGMHKIQERPIALNGEIVIRPMMYVALSYDHRIVDGSEAVRFLVRIKELVEDPETLLLEG